MCQVSSSAWTAQNHRPQMPQWDVAAELQGSAIGETASQELYCHHLRDNFALAVIASL
jgi:hypothetical protein